MIWGVKQVEPAVRASDMSEDEDKDETGSHVDSGPGPRPESPICPSGSIQTAFGALRPSANANMAVPTNAASIEDAGKEKQKNGQKRPLLKESLKSASTTTTSRIGFAKGRPRASAGGSK